MVFLPAGIRRQNDLTGNAGRISCRLAGNSRCSFARVLSDFPLPAAWSCCCHPWLLLDSQPGRQRELVIAVIVSRIVDPCSKLATARALHSDTLHTSLGELRDVGSADETELYQAMDWLLPRGSLASSRLAQRHLREGGLVRYDLTSTYFEGIHC